MKKITTACLIVMFALSTAPAKGAPSELAGIKKLDLLKRTGPVTEHPDVSQWPKLFPEGLANADFQSGVWTLSQGEFTASKDQALWTKKEYKNFILDLEFKTDPGSNSGILLYVTDINRWIPNSVEVQITDDSAKQWADADPTWRCGAIFGRLAASKSVVKKPGEWNRYTITCEGPFIDVVLNGEHVTSMDMRKWNSATKNPDGSKKPGWLNKPLSTHPTRGRIGFQGKHGGKAIWFRNIRIKTMESKPQARIKLGLQLYSVRNDCRKDFDATLAAVAKMGYEGVEFAGYYTYGNDAPGLKKKLDELGLVAAGTHIRAHALEAKNIEQTIAFHKTIGCKYLIVPGDGRFTDPKKSKGFADFMNQAAKALKPHGMYCGYHNHTREMKKADGDKSHWDLFAERTNKDVVLQLDVGWARAAGVDPVALIRKHPGRTKTTHCKAHGGTEPIIGQDGLAWAGIAKACYEVGGSEWFVVEQEGYPDGKSPLESSELSLIGFKKILATMEK